MYICRKIRCVSLLHTMYSSLGNIHYEQFFIQLELYEKIPMLHFNLQLIIKDGNGIVQNFSYEVLTYGNY